MPWNKNRVEFNWRTNGPEEVCYYAYSFIYLRMQSLLLEFIARCGELVFFNLFNINLFLFDQKIGLVFGVD